MPQVAIDMHSDALTLKKPFCGQVNFKSLKEGAISLQCLAAFCADSAAAAYAAAARAFNKISSAEGFCAVKNFKDYEAARSQGKTALALTAENIGFTDGDFKKIKKLKDDGVIMASLVWNNENSLAYPNLYAGGREQRPLKEKGRFTVFALDDLSIIVDVSHLSDGGAEEILKGRKLPAVASHSNCDKVTENPRNLTDLQLRLLADCGGVAGINFYKKFLGGEGYARVAAHLKHMIKVAGEDTPALGSDWDGVPENSSILSPVDMPKLFDYLCRNGIKARTAEKFFSLNFLRVFKCICS